MPFWLWLLIVAVGNFSFAFFINYKKPKMRIKHRFTLNMFFAVIFGIVMGLIGFSW